MLLMLTFGTLKAVNCSTNSTNYQWELNIMLLRNGQVTTDNIFAPFDQVQLCSNVTYGSAPQPDSLVVFKVRGPVNAPTIFSTNATSQADCPFRLPIPSQNNNSEQETWQASATIQTNGGDLKQTLNFTTKWNIVIESISLQNGTGQYQNTFLAGSQATANLQ